MTIIPKPIISTPGNHAMKWLKVSGGFQGSRDTVFPRLVALCGRAGSGKDSTAKLLTQRHGYRRVAFADALRRAVAAITGWHVDALESPTFKDTYDARFNCTPRQFMQRLGTEVGRNIDPEIWLKAWAATVQPIPDTVGVVVTDVRFHNEARLIHQRGGLLVCVKRLVTDAAPVLHESEANAHFLGHDAEIQNDGTLDDLLDKLQHVLNAPSDAPQWRLAQERWVASQRDVERSCGAGEHSPDALGTACGRCGAVLEAHKKGWTNNNQKGSSSK